VINTRLPFEVPTHLLLEARLEEVDRKGGNRFRDVLFPTAVLKFKNAGHGRCCGRRSIDCASRIARNLLARSLSFEQTFSTLRSIRPTRATGRHTSPH
jgi:hypothetical protein